MYKKLAIIGIGLLGVLFMVILLLQIQKRPSTPSEVPIPTPIQAEPQTQTSADKFITSIQHPEPLSETGVQKKKDLLSKINNTSGILTTTDMYQITYLASPQIFQVEIYTQNIEQAKTQSMAWFIQQGLSNSDFCALHLMYFPSPDVQQTIRSSGGTFNVLPLGCSK